MGIEDRGYSSSDVLVSTDWVADNMADTANVRLVESNEDFVTLQHGPYRQCVSYRLDF